ncbi:MAG: homoserine dehydrogenase [Candidatus Bathyarchaeota archaeon]|nr:homoserine dehydrogenase [Candidatus Bathyarchaeota archaeon]
MRIILIGFGVVGQNFSKMIVKRTKELIEKFKFYPRIVAIVDKGGAVIDKRGINVEYALKVKHKKGSVAYVDEFGVKDLDGGRVIEEVDADVVVETTPTNIVNGEPGLTHIRTALKMGKHVVTTNKGPLALAFPALMELANHNNLFLRFSGCVGGGTPILDFAKKCLLGDYIISFKGILNGTTNYILTRMTTNKISFEEALLEARRAGYAETDPSLDIDGWDSACKLVILSNWVLGTKAVLQDVKVKGIRGITLVDVEDALKQNCEIKLIASAENGKLEVKPQPIQKTHPLCVNGILNAVTFVSNYAGEETIIGKGAGGIETASAILRDLLTIKEGMLKV